MRRTEMLNPRWSRSKWIINFRQGRILVKDLEIVKLNVILSTHYGSELRKNGQNPLKFFVSKTFENMFILVL